MRLHLFDISNDEEISREYSIFSPTMTIVNDKHRLHGPFTKDRIIAMLEDEDTAPSSYRVNQSSEGVRGGASANHLEIGPSDLRALHKLGGPRPVQGQVGMGIRHA